MPSLSTLGDLTLVVAGFSLIVFLHELGHFLAARWAGIRVLAFAMGFGPAIASYRRGLGLRRGSSEREYQSLVLRGGAGGRGEVSPTEYRFNSLPFGGYVKMLGQDDTDPRAVSDAKDSYQRCPVWKRLVVISAGVVVNLLTAVVLFIVVFLVGMKVEPARVGLVAPGSPAARAEVLDASVAAAQGQGLREGDVLEAIDGRKPNSFNDLVIAVAMLERGESLRLRVRREGIDAPFDVDVRAEASRLTGLQEIGIEPMRSTRLVWAQDEATRTEITAQFAKIGFDTLRPGMRLVSVGGASGASDGQAIIRAVRASGGKPVQAEFAGDVGERTTVTVTPRPAFQHDLAPQAKADEFFPVSHVLGLTPVLRVGEIIPGGGAEAAGLKAGDIFARLGGAEFPAAHEGVREIRARAGGEVSAVVLRRDGNTWREVQTPAIRVAGNGTIGFGVDDTSDMNLLAAPPERLRTLGRVRDAGLDYAPAATRLLSTPGVSVLSINDRATPDLGAIREALRAAAPEGSTSAEVRVRFRRPVAGRPDASGEEIEATWTLDGEDLAELHTLSWESPLHAGLFESERVLLKADGPVEAVSMGVGETRRVMLTTYLTFVRLAQGTIKVEHLKGPVGIAHLGTLVAGRGFIWLLFFLALVSVNLAVINFLPLPIVDGGQFLFLLFEGVRGKPVPIVVQNAWALAGLVLIAGVFLYVTFHDVKNLLGL